MNVRLLTTEEVAQRFRTSPSTVRYWRHLGIGPAGIRVGRRVLYDEAECDRWWQSKVTAAARDGFSSSIGVGTRTGGL
jgi:DNA-binding transcriptional MerR regulator